MKGNTMTRLLIPISILTALASLVLRHYELTLAASIVGGAAGAVFLVALAGGDE